MSQRVIHKNIGLMPKNIDYNIENERNGKIRKGTQRF